MNGEHGHLEQSLIRYCVQIVVRLQNVREEEVQRLIEEFTARFEEKVHRFLFEEDSRVAKHVLSVSFDKALGVLSVSIDDSLGGDEGPALLVIKNGDHINFDTPLESQISSFALSDGVLIKAVIFLINNGLPHVTEMIREQLGTPGEMGNGEIRLRELGILVKSFAGSMVAPDFVADSHTVIKEMVFKGANDDNYLDYIEPERMQDSTFLNMLQGTANEWLKKIQMICQARRDIKDGSLFDEVQYWATLQDTLVSIKQQLQSPEVLITISILAATKRWHTVSGLAIDSGLDDKLKTVKGYNQFVSSIPLKALRLSDSIKRLSENLDLVAAALKKFRFTSYPAERFAILLEQVSWQVQKAILHVSPNLFTASFTTFSSSESEIIRAIEQWDGIVQENKIHLREVIRKRGESRLSANHIRSPTNELRDALKEISIFRKQHHSLSKSLASIQYPDYSKDLDFVYEPIRALQNMGLDRWSESKVLYTRRLATIEQKLIKLWNVSLASKKSSAELVNHYSLFAPLMSHNPKLSSVMKSCQKELLDSVKLELTLFQEAMRDRDQMEETLRLKSLSPMSAMVVTLSQFRNRTRRIYNYCEILLGIDWEKLPEGKILSPIFNEIMRKTDCETLFVRWKNDLAEFNVEEAITPVLKVVCNQNQTYELSPNFDHNRGSLFGEVKTFVYIGFDVPSRIIRLADKYEDARLSAVRSLEQVQTFLSIINELDGLAFTAYLLEKDVGNIWSLILDAAVTYQRGRSDTSNISERGVARKLERGVGSLLNKFHKLEISEAQLSRSLDKLSTSPYDIKSLSKNIIALQTTVTELASLEPNGMGQVVCLVNHSIEVILVRKLRDQLRESTSQIHVVTVTLETNRLAFSPNVNELKRQEINTVEIVLEGFLKLPRITCPGNQSEEKYDSEITHSLQDAVLGALKNIEERSSLAKKQLKVWKVIGIFNSVAESDIGDYIGSDINICLSLLTDLIESRTKLEELDNRISDDMILRFSLLGSHTSILRKIDYLRKTLCDLLLELYTRSAVQLDQEITDDLISMEELTLQNHFSVDSILSLVTTLQRVKNSDSVRCKLLKRFSNCEDIFFKFHLKLPSDHIFLDHLQNNKMVLDDCFEERTKFVHDNKNGMLTTLDGEEMRLTSRSESALREWWAIKLKLRNMKCSDALVPIEQFRSLFKDINEKAERLYMCSRALYYPMIARNYLNGAFDDLIELESVCKGLGNLEDFVDQLLDRFWSSVRVSDIEKELDQQNENINKGFDPDHQHQGFTKIVKTIGTIANNIPLLKDLKDPALVARHWKVIFEKASVSKSLESLESQSFTLGDVIDLNLTDNVTTIRQIISDAQREAVLEKSLNRIKHFWTDRQFDTFEHRSSMELVRDWKQLQQLASDDLDELLAMKNSRFYSLIAQNCLELESRLAAFVAILPDWTDLQFHWLDLYGIIGEEGKLSILLHTESCKFKDLTADFQNILSNVFQLPSVLDISHIPGSENIFKQMANRLKMIRSSLSAFLEQQRLLFPRFYFLGDRDLLRLLGTDDDLSQVSSYLGKMFGSFTDLLVESHSIKGVYSAEGELLELFRPIDIHETQGPQEWLKTLDSEIKDTLLKSVELSFQAISEGQDFLELLDSRPFQVLLLTWQLYWTAQVEKTTVEDNLKILREAIGDKIGRLSKCLIHKERLDQRQKICSLIVELTHSLDVVTALLESYTERSVIWYRTQKFYYKSAGAGFTGVYVQQCGRNVRYSFNYIGVPERLIYTSTMEEAFAALIEALTQGFGGCLFGPAGTGKTETIKSLSQNLGKMVLVFNCDNSFDFRAMSRLLFGVAQIGAWGCFDELNRLDPNVLSSVTGPVENILKALSKKSHDVQIMKKSLLLNPDTGLFVTLNPSYGGRSHLPEILKNRFREYSMTRAETPVISEVMMSVLAFKGAKALSRGIVNFFAVVKDTCSPQRHYDFGLRSIKKVLQNCATSRKHGKRNGDEKSLLRNSLTQIILPSLNASDEGIFRAHIEDVFPEDEAPDLKSQVGCPPTCDFQTHLLGACREEFVTPSVQFLKKCQQLYHMQRSQQAIILMGDAGVGKTSVWRTTLRAMKYQSGLDNIVYVIDTKTMGKDSLYGRINKATLEWKDGVFTSILRAVNDDLTGSFANVRIWIILDSDLDPEYIETLNSALDDNKLLTLPTGERIPIPDKVRLLLEVTDLKHATPATMTRCAILWIAVPTYSADEQLEAVLEKEIMKMNEYFGVSAKLIRSFHSLVSTILSHEKLTRFIMEANKLEHVMGFQESKCVPVSIKMFSTDVRTHSEALESYNQAERTEYMVLRLYQILFNLVASDIPPSDQEIAAKHLYTIFGGCYRHLIEDGHLRRANLKDGRLEYVPLSDLLQKQESNHRMITNSNVIIPTLDTMRHEYHISELLKNHLPIILCGPPGSGKTMLINSIFSRSKKYQLICMNFSKDTKVSHIFRAINRHMKYIDGSRGLTLSPKNPSKDIILFCDEVNLPKPDKYESQGVTLFLRLLIEKGGFWRVEDNKWISMERFHVIGACNPSTDPGRVALSPRFMRHICVLFVSHASSSDLSRIYRSLIQDSFDKIPGTDTSSVCEASICLYKKCQTTFTTSVQSHYAFSPRELTRWIRGMYSAVTSGLHTTFLSVLRIWAHEAWRIFADRFTKQDEKLKFQDLLGEVVSYYFPHANTSLGDTSRLLFSSWLSSKYEEVSRADMSEFLRNKMNLFCLEKGLDQLVVHDEFLDHALRIDRVLKQSQGHCMLIGAGRSGRTTLVKFVCWLNDVHFLQPSMHKTFDISDFDNLLRNILLKCTVEERKICLIIDESNIRETAFLERMNTLLANSDVPDLFQRENYEILICSLKQKFESDELSNSSEEELYSWFTSQISKNLHVVFTMSDSSTNKSSQIVTSPALFNRCVIDWVGKWSISTLRKVSQDFINCLPFKSHAEKSAYIDFSAPSNVSEICRESLTQVFLLAHDELSIEQDLFKSPGFFVDTHSLFTILLEQKCHSLEKSYHFFANGLKKLEEATMSFKSLKIVLKQNEQELQTKEVEAREVLDQILSEQNEAKRRQDATQDIRVELVGREEEARRRRNSVHFDLKALEPIMQAAKLGVKNIKKQHLTEIRSMINPPLAVKLTLEAVCSVLGYNISEWRSLQQFVRSDEFMLSILYFDAESQLSKESKMFVEKTLLSKPELTFDKVQRASKACGPLFQWVTAQIKFGDVLEKIDPLKVEARALENDVLSTKAKLLAAEGMISDLEESILQSKDNYRQVVKDMELIRSSAIAVREKLERAKKLIEGLSEERDRWERSIEDLGKEAACAKGNCLVSSLIFTYFGKLDERQRAVSLQRIFKLLQENSIPYDSEYDFIRENTTSESQKAWLTHASAKDTHFLSNCLMIFDCAAVPYIIDPGLKVPAILSNEFGSRLEIISFIETGFIKKFINSVKFGSMLLIKDAEQYDPIISQVVTCVAQKTRSARSIQIGDLEVSISPAFRLYLHSSDANRSLPNSLESRVRVVNFSMSRASVESQVVSVALAHEAPEIEAKRLETFELNANYESRLRSLENRILDRLSGSKGGILENNDFLISLKKVKLEANEISRKLSENRNLIERVFNFTESYASVFSHCTCMFSLLKRFKQLHWFYEVPSWQFFLCLEEVFLSCQEFENNDMNSRLRTLISTAYEKFYYVFSAFLSQNDRMKLVFILHLMQHHDLDMEGLRKRLKRLLEQLMTNQTNDSENPFFKELTAQGLIKEASCAAAIKWARKNVSKETSIERLAASSNKKSILLATDKGSDCCFEVMRLAESQSKNLSVIALGSSESTDYAEEEILRCAQDGSWVLLQNLQTSMPWVHSFLAEKIEQQLECMDVWEKDFKIFMTCNLSEEPLPSVLLQQSHKVLIEGAPTVLNTVKTLWKNLASENPRDSPSPRAAIVLKFLLVWFHAILDTRSHLVPVGFKKTYDFNDCDLQCGLACVTELLNASYQGNTELICERLHFSLGKIIYGGKVDEEEDLKTVQKICCQLFQPAAIDSSDSANELCEILPGVTLPRGPLDKTLLSQFLDHICEPSDYYTLWLGLPDNAIHRFEFKTIQQAIQGAIAILQ